MAPRSDGELIAALRREIDRYRSPVNDQQDEWATSARLAIERLGAERVDDDDRAAARGLLRRIGGGSLS